MQYPRVCSIRSRNCCGEMSRRGELNGRRGIIGFPPTTFRYVYLAGTWLLAVPRFDDAPDGGCRRTTAIVVVPVPPFVVAVVVVVVETAGVAACSCVAAAASCAWTVARPAAEYGLCGTCEGTDRTNVACGARCGIDDATTTTCCG